jgi:serine/threonine protein kinase
MMKQKGTMVGTEDYISPEILEEKVSGPAADLWSLGVIVYMMLTGESPFKSQSQFITFRNIRDVKY